MTTPGSDGGQVPEDLSYKEMLMCCLVYGCSKCSKWEKEKRFLDATWLKPNYCESVTTKLLALSSKPLILVFSFLKNTDQKLSSEPTQFKVLKLKEKVHQ